MSELEAFELIDKADKKVNSTSWFPFGGKSKQEDAVDLYTRAANILKNNKRWKESADTFSKVADLLVRLGERSEASSRYINAAQCYKKCSPEEAIIAYKNGIDILAEAGRFQSAASHQKEIAEILECDIGDMDRAILAYEAAADWYSGEDANALANSCWIKVAHLAAQHEKYEKAIEKFEYVAHASVDNSLAKWSVKEYLLKAGLCRFLQDGGDIVGIKKTIEKYRDIDMTFGSTREYKLLTEILEAVEQGDPQLYTDVVTEYDRFSKLDAWKTSILLKIKKSIEAEPSLT
ncbi:TPR-like protein [Rozella allomycis CSF55]|uniref:TPR-like protein n=1 Tax=Rozella allomycis (strain CSF55) TaxID=988480 RepID=A0A075B452_ROZAC|nr:Tetratricopeptide-like helical domain-containing protein [Rozella allomycis CSF55]RKP20072.1 TPR-like protein [Rozella allomycis CSF55]|eukprot:EPZ35874.1 Tetratricopeptide-like helical domain-containing protein [Rozella allomycis CSF55]